jgi:tRNA nucleotidyltransferase (CCA-adding enzyme)
VYGAESYIHGFSGHVLELLILHYDSFEKLLKATTKWKAPIIIDIEKHYDSAAAALLRLNEAKIQSPVIIIDPVQPDRNAAAALSRKAFEVFKQRAQGFLKKPGKEYFDIRVNKATIKKQWKLYSILFKTAKTPRGKPDVVGCKLLAKYEKAIKLFKENEFPLVHADWRYGEKQTIAWYVLRNITMPKEREQQGPPASIQAAVETFRAKHPDAYERSGRWHAKVKRKYTKAQDILKAAWNS